MVYSMKTAFRNFLIFLITRRCHLSYQQAGFSYLKSKYPENGEYMSFGLSGDDQHSVMVGADVVVAWVDQRSLNGYAHDYYLDAKSQCAGTRGSCPDYRIEPNTESVRLLNAALVNGYSIVTYQRPLKAHDGLDRAIVTNQSQPIIWAVGPLNGQQEVSYHSVTSKGDIFIDFGRAPKWNCPIPESDHSEPQTTNHQLSSDDQAQHESIVKTRTPQQATTTNPPVYKTPPPPQSVSKKGAWSIPPIQCDEPEDGVFYAQMGPTGGKHGYPAITGHVGWGIAYYINGLLIPEIHVVRGRTYTFVVEGGEDPNIPAKFHPFYITDDPVGGYQYKTPEERKKVNIYAGAELNKQGEVVPTGVGRLCNWNPDPEQGTADEFASFGAYQRTLTLVCDRGEPAVVQWTPDKDTPDTVYYQCFAHRYLGWKIHVHDRCDAGQRASASEPIGSIVSPEDELLAKPSIVVSTRVKPDFPPQSINDDFKKDTVHEGKDGQFGTKATSYTIIEKGKYEIKDNKFPYEIYKPSTNEYRPNMTDTVIPVKEETDDLETTTFKMTVVAVNSSSSFSSGGPETPTPVLKATPGRNPFRGQLSQQSNPSPIFLQHPANRRPVTVMIRRPGQQPGKPQVQHIPMMSRPPPIVQHSPSQQRPIIVKKPIIRLPQRPIAVSQASLQHANTNQRPMLTSVMPTHPLPPQPPPMPPRPMKPAYVHKFKKPIVSFVTPLPDKNKYKISPSAMISQKAEESTARLPIAVNTGFNPGSLVIESGFKPIINTPVAEERVSEVEYDDDDNNEGVIKMDSLDEQKAQTEMFEPMFIPSPLDSNVKHVKKATTEPVKKVRKPYRQVVMRRPVYTNDEPLFRSEPDEDEEPIAAGEKVDALPQPTNAAQATVVTYDGKEVKNDDAPALPSNHKPSESAKTTQQLTSEPQTRPFEGEAPPPVPSRVAEDIPQLHLHSEDGAVASALPLGEDQHKRTKLTVVNDTKDPVVDSTDKIEVPLTEPEITPNHETSTKKDTVEPLGGPRRRREAHHDDHSNHSDHDHDHSMHDHSKAEQKQKVNGAALLMPSIIIPITLATILAL